MLSLNQVSRASQRVRRSIPIAQLAALSWRWLLLLRLPIQKCKLQSIKGKSPITLRLPHIAALPGSNGWSFRFCWQSGWLRL